MYIDVGCRAQNPLLFGSHAQGDQLTAYCSCIATKRRATSSLQSTRTVVHVLFLACAHTPCQRSRTACRVTQASASHQNVDHSRQRCACLPTKLSDKRSDPRLCAGPAPTRSATQPSSRATARGQRLLQRARLPSKVVRPQARTTRQVLILRHDRGAYAVLVVFFAGRPALCSLGFRVSQRLAGFFMTTARAPLAAGFLLTGDFLPAFFVAGAFSSLPLPSSKAIISAWYATRRSSRRTFSPRAHSEISAKEWCVSSGRHRTNSSRWMNPVQIRHGTRLGCPEHTSTPDCAGGMIARSPDLLSLKLAARIRACKPPCVGPRTKRPEHITSNVEVQATGSCTSF